MQKKRVISFHFANMPGKRKKSALPETTPISL
jgi:hypothetical protein